jgi:hypothetical protein
VGQLASEAALDHWLTWQLRHVAADDADVAELAAAYQRGEPGPPPTQARTSVQAETRLVDSDARSRLLNLRYLAAARYREVRADAFLRLNEPDRLLLSRQSADAVQAYRRLIAGSADSQPDAWIGLALALHQLPSSGPQRIFATDLPVMFELHGRLGGQVDPLELARWFA